MKNYLAPLLLVLGLTLGTMSNATAGLVWQQVTEVPTQSTLRVYAHNDTLYCGSGARVYRWDHQSNQWDTLAVLDPDVTLTSAIIKAGNRLFAGTYNLGVFESDNNGASWVQNNAGLSGLGSNSIMDFTIRGDSLYVGTSGAGVFVMNLTTPSNWVGYQDGMPDNIASDVNTLFSVGDYVLAGAGLNSDIYRNGPDTTGWNEYPFFTFDPRGAGMLDMTSLGDLVYGVTSNGLYISHDSGATWLRFAVTNRLIAAGSVAADKDIVYGSIWLPAFGTFYFSSTGSNWQVIDSVQFALTYNIEVLGGRLYAGREDGLWYAELTPTDVGDKPGLPDDFTLAQNYPNPFNPTTSIEFTLPARGPVSLDVFNLVGQRVRTLVSDFKSAGKHSVIWDGTSDAGQTVSSGVYFYRLSTASFTTSRKMVLLK
jgi:hypothetical protein